MGERFRFGDFEFDGGSGELRGPDGATQRLPPQPAGLLRMLVDRQGAVVTREQIRQRLWPDTHVDFDASLHFCVRQVRAALGDSGSEARYVENVPRRGYRLVPAVTLVNGAVSGRRVLAVVAAILAIGVAATLYFIERRTLARPQLRIAIMPFEPPIGEWILQDLSTIGGDAVGLVGPTTTAGYLASSTPPGAGSDAHLRRLAADYRIDYVVNGRFLGRSGGPRLLAELIRASDGVHVWVQPYEDLTDARRVGEEISRSVARTLELSP